MGVEYCDDRFVAVEANEVPRSLAGCTSSRIVVFQPENWLRCRVGCVVPTHPTNPCPRTDTGQTTLERLRYRGFEAGEKGEKSRRTPPLTLILGNRPTQTSSLVEQCALSGNCKVNPQSKLGKNPTVGQPKTTPPVAWCTQLHGVYTCKR